MVPVVLRPSACQTVAGVLQVGPQSLALGLGPGHTQAQYLGINSCLHHCLVVLERQHLQQRREQIREPIPF